MVLNQPSDIPRLCASARYSPHTEHGYSNVNKTLYASVRLEAGVPPISVCLTVGLPLWYWHMRLRSESVSVFRGVDEVRGWVEDADTGVADAGVMGRGAEGNSGA